MPASNPSAAISTNSGLRRSPPRPRDEAERRDQRLQQERHHRARRREATTVRLAAAQGHRDLACATAPQRASRATGIVHRLGQADAARRANENAAPTSPRVRVPLGSSPVASHELRGRAKTRCCATLRNASTVGAPCLTVKFCFIARQRIANSRSREAVVAAANQERRHFGPRCPTEQHNARRDVSRRDMLWAGARSPSALLSRSRLRPLPRNQGALRRHLGWIRDARVTHHRTNGVRLHVAEQGSGPLVILCHGFPECWYSWRHQLPALAKAGFRAVAPDLRGYGRSDRPEEVEKYTILHDIGDIVGLVDALGAEQAVIAGHDVGATMAWQAALLRPDRFRAVIALSVPFRPRGFGGSVPPTTLMPRNEDAVFYQLFLQTPEAEAALGRDMRRTFRSQFYSLSGDRPPSVAGGFAAGMIPRKGGALTDPASLPSWASSAACRRPGRLS